MTDDCSNIPYSGFFTLLLNDYPAVKYTLIGLLAVSTLITKDPN